MSGPKLGGLGQENEAKAVVGQSQSAAKRKLSKKKAQAVSQDPRAKRERQWIGPGPAIKDAGQQYGPWKSYGPAPNSPVFTHLAI